MLRFALLRNTLRTTCLFSTLAILGMGSAHAQPQPAIFSVPTQVPLPSEGTPLFIGDINGDGKADLAYLVYAGATPNVDILLDFAGNAPTNVSTTICDQALFADVNNDHKLDAVSSCNGYITVQLGNGDATFQAPAYYALNAGIPVLVDLNGDGYLDIAALLTGSPAPSQVAILLNNGSAGPGLFGPAKQYAVPTGTSGLFAGDFNGDGKQDLLTPVPYDDENRPPPLNSTATLGVLFGNGDGSLRPATVQTEPAFGSTAVGDFNGDGVTDVAVMLTLPSNDLYASVQILLGATSGTFTQGASLPVVATSQTVQGAGGPLTAVSLSDNGLLDLVVNTGVLNFFKGDGKGGFTPTASYGVASSPNFLADVDGDGKPDLIATLTSGVLILPGNGDGTFQAPPAAPFNGTTADVNNDGIADMLFFPQAGLGSSFATALGRGDGTYSILNQATAIPGGFYQLMTGDFNGDGNIDTVTIQPSEGRNGSCGPPNAQLLSYLGSGSGQFVATGTAAFGLGVSNVQPGITGDFNSDGKLDLLLPNSLGCNSGPQLLFVPGNGDGTFGTPVSLSNTQSLPLPNLVAGDLNNDKKLDFIFGNAVFLGNGDGTFKQIPLNIVPPAALPSIATLIALADLNGDGRLDAVYNTASIYAGKGDGTFETTPFFTSPILPRTVAFGDVNGDGNPDLQVQSSSNTVALYPSFSVFLGDGHGNFTQDPNEYFTGTVADTPQATTPVRLNNQAPPLASDNRLDLSVFIAGNDGTWYTTSLLNQTNPTPMKPAPIASTTALQASPATAAPNVSITLTASVFGTYPTGSVSFTANGNSLGTESVTNGIAVLETSFPNIGSYPITATYSGDSNNTAGSPATTTVTISPAASSTTLEAPSGGNVNGQITLKATVSGDNPTGSVSFSAGNTALGTATLTSGVATLQTSFAAAGSYSVTAAYKGDQNNTASTSNAATILIAAPDFTISAAPTSGTVTAGKSATFTFTVSPVGGYAGTVSFSCGTLPSQAACSFTPASVTPSGGSSVSTTMTVSTTSTSAMVRPEQRSRPSLPPWFPPSSLALAGGIGLAFAPKKIRRLHHQVRALCWALLLASLSLLASGCGGGGGGSSPSNPDTPAGSYTISVTASGSAGGQQHAMNITLVVQ
jgi:Bacterial Ig-like domain (group 3)/FG-GAP-like repeat